MIRILVLADEEDKGLWDFYSKEKFEGIDLIISCGDLHPEYLEFLESMTNLTLLYVRGNHDGKYDYKPPRGCVGIDDRIYTFRGVRILGLGGSYRYHDGPDMYTEREMFKRIRRLGNLLRFTNGFDILVTHAPAKGYGDLDDLPHYGFDCFNKLISKWKPAFMFHGHVHQTYTSDFKREMLHDSGTVIINAYKSCVIDIHPHQHPEKGKTGSFLFDLYVNITGGKDYYGKA